MSETNSVKNKEIELKLGLLHPCSFIEEALGSAGKVSNVRQDNLQNIYFDTADKKLFGMKAGLRIRRGSNFAEQTLKMRGQTLGGIHIRNEYNINIDGDLQVPDLKLFPEGVFPPEIKLQELQSSLEIQCEINFVRQCYDLEYKNCVFEIAVDTGLIQADGKQCPLLELEIEVKRCDENTVLLPLFDELVQKLAAAGVPLTMEPFSKMRRAALLMGYDNRNSIALPENNIEDIVSYISLSLRTFEVLLGLFMAKKNPVCLGYMAYTLKCLRRSYDYMVDCCRWDETINDSQSFYELQHTTRKVKRTLKKLSKYMHRMEKHLMSSIFAGEDPDLDEAVYKVRAKISKLKAYVLPLHIRAVLAGLEEVKKANLKV